MLEDEYSVCMGRKKVVEPLDDTLLLGLKDRPKRALLRVIATKLVGINSALN
jgi:hypothetical protein